MTSRVRTTLLGVSLIVVAGGILLWSTMSGAGSYYMTPTELAQAPPDGPVRLYGVVVPGSASMDGAGRLRLQVTDGTTAIDVISHQLPGPLLRDGMGVVMLGRPAGTALFQADELLAKHSEVYRASGPGQTMPPSILDDLLEA